MLMASSCPSAVDDTSILRTGRPDPYRRFNPDQQALAKPPTARKLSRSDLVHWHIAPVAAAQQDVGD